MSRFSPRTVTLFDIPLVVSSVATFAADLIKTLQSRSVPVHSSRAVMVVSMQDVMARRFQPTTRSAFPSFDYFTMDGMPLVWLARWLGYPAERVYGPDLLQAMLEQTQGQNISHYFYGGTPATLRALEAAVKARYPKVVIAGKYAPPFRSLTSAELTTVIQQINQARPDIVWVGLGSWKQLEWVKQVKPQLKTQLIIPVGMAFDLWAGTKAQAPLWMQRTGLEWLFRLIQEPGRLGSRYLLQLPIFAVWWLGELVTQSWRHWFSKSRSRS